MTAHRNKKLAQLIESGDVLGFKSALKKILVESLDDELPDAIDAPALGTMTPTTDPEALEGDVAADIAAGKDPEDLDPKLNEDDADPSVPAADPADGHENEASCVDVIRKAAVALSGDQGYYDNGLLDISIPTLENAKQFAAFLDACDHVESYEVEGLSFDSSGEPLASDSRDLAELDGGDFVAFDFYIYLDTDIVTEDPVSVDDGDVVDDENGTLMEVKRLVRVQFGSGKRSKMQCKPGHRFNHSTGGCQKLDEEEQNSFHRDLKHKAQARHSLSGAKHTPITRKSHKNAKARKKFGLGR